MEALLRTEYPDYVTIQAYADDVVVSVAGSTRANVIRRVEQVLQPVLQWADYRGLKFSAKKSTALMTKGYLVPGFTVQFGEDRISTTQRTKYLGVILDDARKWDCHIETLTEKADDLFSRLRGTMGAGWGIKRDNLMLLCRAVFLPRVSYGVCFWSQATSTRHNRNKLYKLQRRVLLGLTSAYRTTSTEALQVVAGVLPLDLELRWIAEKQEAKMLPDRLRTNTTRDAYKRIVDEWQDRWTNSSKGRWIYHCFPDVRTRLRSPIAMGHEIAQFLTGHGNFRAKLQYFNLQPSPICSCGVEDEDVSLVLYRCVRHDTHRAQLELAVQRAGRLWPCDMVTLVSSRSLYRALMVFAKIAAYYEQPD